MGGMAFDLPTAYLREVAVGLFIENRLARGEFVCRGRKIDLSAMQCPLYVLVGRDDQTTPPAQALAAVSSTASDQTEVAIAPCGHLSLFMGARTLTEEWPALAAWFRRDAAAQHTSRKSKRRQDF
jgi:poly(3-hydroxyalkanoate) synthetase